MVIAHARVTYAVKATGATLVTFPDIIILSDYRQAYGAINIATTTHFPLHTVHLQTTFCSSSPGQPTGNDGDPRTPSGYLLSEHVYRQHGPVKGAGKHSEQNAPIPRSAQPSQRDN